MNGLKLNNHATDLIPIGAFNILYIKYRGYIQQDRLAQLPLQSASSIGRYKNQHRVELERHLAGRAPAGSAGKKLSWSRAGARLWTLRGTTVNWRATAWGEAGWPLKLLIYLTLL
jgi:hypothetical protein